MLVINTPVPTDSAAQFSVAFACYELNISKITHHNWPQVWEKMVEDNYLEFGTKDGMDEKIRLSEVFEKDPTIEFRFKWNFIGSTIYQERH